MTGVPSEAVEWLPQPVSRPVNPNTRVEGSRRAAAAAGANDGHQAIPSNRWARAFSAPSLRGTDRQSVPRNYSDLGVAGPESGASLPVSRRFQLIVSCTAPVVLPRR